MEAILIIGYIVIGLGFFYHAFSGENYGYAMPVIIAGSLIFAILWPMSLIIRLLNRL